MWSICRPSHILVGVLIYYSLVGFTLATGAPVSSGKFTPALVVTADVKQEGANASIAPVSSTSTPPPTPRNGTTGNMTTTPVPTTTVPITTPVPPKPTVPTTTVPITAATPGTNPPPPTSRVPVIPTTSSAATTTTPTPSHWPFANEVCMVRVLENCTTEWYNVNTHGPCKMTESTYLASSMSSAIWEWMKSHPQTPPFSCTWKDPMKNTTTYTLTIVAGHGPTPAPTVLTTTKPGPASSTTTTVQPAVDNRSNFRKYVLFFIICVVVAMVCYCVYRKCSSGQNWEAFKTQCAITRSNIRAWFRQRRENGVFTNRRTPSNERPIGPATGLLNNDYDML